VIGHYRSPGERALPLPTTSTVPNTSTVPAVSQSEPPAAGLAATFQGFVGTLATVRVAVSAPPDATEMAITDDPSFAGVAWNPVQAEVRLAVAATGYVEIFARFRQRQDGPFIRAIAGITIPQRGDASDRPENPDRPNVWSVGAVASNTLAVTIRVGRVAVIEGVRRVVGSTLDATALDRATNVALTSTDDPTFDHPLAVTAVVRRTQPIDIADDDANPRFSLEHSLFVSLAQPLEEGRNYRLSLLGMLPTSFRFDTTKLRSPAIQVNQVGFMPADPAKMAYLSASLAGQRSLDYDDKTEFVVIDASSEARAFLGRASLRVPPKDGEYGRGDLTGARVWELDFTALTKVGRYRVCVMGVGCSYDFAISPSGTWLKATALVARAAFDQRSGLSLGPPRRWFGHGFSTPTMRSRCGPRGSRCSTTAKAPPTPSRRCCTKQRARRCPTPGVGTWMPGIGIAAFNTCGS
jgi:hypothetical protein